MKSLSRMFWGVMEIVAMTALSLGSVSAATDARETPPPPAAPRPVNLPKPVEKTLANGLRVVVVERKGLPLISAQLVIKQGSEVDPNDKAGLAKLTGALLTEGTTTRTAPQIAEAVDALGATLAADAAWDGSSVSVSVLASKFDAAMDIFADVARHPAFDEKEVDRVRKQTLDELTIDLSEPSTIARYVAARVVFGGGPYGHGMAGTPQSIPKITRDDLVKLHASMYRPDNAVLVIAGEIGADAAFATAERVFGGWAKGTAAVAPAAESGAPSASRRVVVVDKADAGQAAVLLARLGFKRTDPDYYTGLVLNSVMGGGYSARLNQEIRIKRGLSYGAFSRLDSRRDAGTLVASTQTKNQSGGEVAGLIVGELKRLADEPVPPGELTPRKATLTGNFARRLETLNGLVAEMGRLAVNGIGFDEINQYVGKVEGVTAADIQKLAAGRLGPDSANVILVGDSKQFLEALKKAFPTVEVIPEAELDLDSPKLRK